jgi:Mn2+/Fe2+ NRAMP family transporter
MFGVLIIIATIILIVAMFFLPTRIVDNVALVLAVVSLSVTAYTLWIIIPGHLEEIKQHVKDIRDNTRDD